ncbi:PTS sugar transporter subunit IIA [Staphylococcus simulans]|uniref:PTS sugar transporter subunit IIA n=1 Tax=Staphylococcus simulans TaxID=1286 RepID=UPI001E585FB0|nr:PTS sugar transporter subunit IIA [Staphylococcus simulans]MCD8915839.1 PTS sugar transporter subunit IIA [Staphylococcus simulans]
MSYLFSKDSVFVSNADSKEAVLAEVTEALLKAGYVKDNYLEHVLEREKNYPTGLILSNISETFPNIAVPHTEPEFVNTTKIVPVKLTNPVVFQNMSSPHKDLPVDFVFLILNSNKSSQVHLLSDLILFFQKEDKKEMEKFFKLTDADAIYEYLQANF